MSSRAPVSLCGAARIGREKWPTRGGANGSRAAAKPAVFVSSVTGVAGRGRCAGGVRRVVPSGRLGIGASCGDNASWPGAPPGRPLEPTFRIGMRAAQGRPATLVGRSRLGNVLREGMRRSVVRRSARGRSGQGRKGWGRSVREGNAPWVRGVTARRDIPDWNARREGRPEVGDAALAGRDQAGAADALPWPTRSPGCVLRRFQIGIRAAQGCERLVMPRRRLVCGAPRIRGQPRRQDIVRRSARVPLEPTFPSFP